MKDSTSQYLYSVFRQAFQEFKIVGLKLLEFLKRTPLPRVLVFCIALALLITIIPLVITLFLIFFLLKLLISMTASTNMAKQEPKARTRTDDDVEIIYPRKRIDD